MSVVTFNPNFDGPQGSKLTAQETPMPPHPTHRRVRVLATLASVAVVATVAFVGGMQFGSNESKEGVGSLTQATSPRSSSLKDMYAANPSLASITPQQLDELVTTYAQAPEEWNNAFVEKEFVAEWLSLRAEEGNENTSEDINTRLLLRAAQDDEPATRGRELIGPYPVDTARLAYDHVFLLSRDDKFEVENDAVVVAMDGNTCVISFDRSTDLADWIDNLRLGNGPVLSINKYTETHESCPTSVCEDYRTLGRAYNGFRVGWNLLRNEMWARMQSNCGGASKYLFAGFSRGGGIATLAAAAVYVEGLVPASKIQLLTFGCPRSLSDAMSDAVHLKFEQYRFIYRKDPMPSLIFDSWGMRHVGLMRCFECNYAEDRDRPFWFNPFNINDHFQYKFKDVFYP